MKESPIIFNGHDFFAFFDENSAKKYLEGLRWKKNIDCPHCGSIVVTQIKNGIPMPYRCRSCRRYFSVRTGTVLADSHIPLQKWLIAIHIMVNLKIASLDYMASQLDITPKSACFVINRLQMAFSNTDKNKFMKIDAEGETSVSKNKDFDLAAKKIVTDPNDNVIYEENDFTENEKNLVTKTATYTGTLSLGGTQLSCFVTNNGERFISGRSMTSAIGMKGRGQGTARISTNSTLKPFMNNALIMAFENPVRIVGKSPKPVHGYRAEILADLCDVLLEARKAGALKSEQEIRYGQFAENLVRGFARVGIAALVDEATGYQNVRENDALQRILDRFLKDEARSWSKTFPDEFWEKLVKIKGYSSYYALKRPAFVGHWVNDIVYSRLAPGIKAKLKEINPRLASGTRRNRHHQHLSEDHGLPELKDHLKRVMILMDASSNKQEFEKLLNRSLPKYSSNLELDLG